MSGGYKHVKYRQKMIQFTIRSIKDRILIPQWNNTHVLREYPKPPNSCPQCRKFHKYLYTYIDAFENTRHLCPDCFFALTLKYAEAGRYLGDPELNQLLIKI
mgnify:CR=1 FL=1